MWRDKVSVIPKGHIFNASINDNITMFNPKIKIKDITAQDSWSRQISSTYPKNIKLLLEVKN